MTDMTQKDQQMMNGTCHCGVSISSFTGTRRGLWSAIVVFVAGCVRFGRMDEGV